MRCLTLAQELTRKGFECSFVSREHPGAMHDVVVQSGFQLHKLSMERRTRSRPHAKSRTPDYSSWVGADPEEDARQTIGSLADTPVNWIVVDHYGLNGQWESIVKPCCNFLLAIDDLERSQHVCDLILDQNLGRTPSSYAGSGAALLLGPQYALLRRSFSDARQKSLSNRKNPQLSNILITMGGMDLDNASGKVLSALNSAEFSRRFRVTVVLNASAPHLHKIETLAKTLRFDCKVLKSVSNMAEIMLQNDLAIGAAGTTSWERCCLGLPAIVIPLAENQKPIAAALSGAKAAEVITTANLENDLLELVSRFLSAPKLLAELTRRSAAIVDGSGASRVADTLARKSGILH